MKYHKKVWTTTIIVITLFAFLYISNLVYQNVKSSNSSNQISAKQITSTHNKIARKEKNWELSDKIRDEISKKGYNLKDLKDDIVIEKITRD